MQRVLNWHFLSTLQAQIKIDELSQNLMKIEKSATFLKTNKKFCS